MKTTVEIERRDILSLISCAETYGFDDDVLFTAFRDWLGTISDDEIKEFAGGHLNQPPPNHLYTEEDVEAITDTLEEFRDKYCREPAK